MAEADGDGNGFETDPNNALSDDGLFAVDLSSGTNSNTDCMDAGKDKQQLYNFGLSVPADAEIQGIVVRLDTKVDSTRNSPQMCVQLSWDGGNSWSSAQTTQPLPTFEATY